MSINLSKDFWTNVNNHKETLDRLFNYLLRTFPIPAHENKKSAFADLLLKFEENGIFQKFDTNLPNKSKSEEKAFEQFLLMWTRHYLSEAYAKRSNEYARFSNTDDIDSVSCDLSMSSDMNALKNIEMKETVKGILSVCKKGIERTVIESRLTDDCSVLDIASKVNRTHQAVSALIQRVKEKCQEKNLLSIA